MMRKIAGFIVLSSCLAGAVFILWMENLSSYLPQKTSAVINQNPADLDFLSSNQVNYLHFFDPSCLNSRINLAHLPRIAENQDGKIKFFLITSSTSNQLKKGVIPSYFTIIEDPSQEIYKYCGVTSTPSAIIYKEGKGSFFANYNGKNGLCGANEIKYSGPALALEFMIEHDKFPILPTLQTNAVGCQIKENKL
ncbi:MAG: hypothetical protein HRT61_08140 [Ekhidna sp.]|nr:hypothetical protein [Ekhidna sp.]